MLSASACPEAVQGPILVDAWQFLENARPHSSYTDGALEVLFLALPGSLLCDANHAEKVKVLAKYSEQVKHKTERARDSL